MRTKRRIIIAASYIVLILVALISIFPIVYAVMIATKQPVDAFSTSFTWIYKPIFDNFKTLWIERGFTKYLCNTLIITGCCVLISVPTATLGAYGLIRNQDAQFDAASEDVSADAACDPLLYHCDKSGTGRYQIHTGHHCSSFQSALRAMVDEGISIK